MKDVVIIKLGDGEISLGYDKKTKKIDIYSKDIGDIYGDVMYVSGCVGEVSGYGCKVKSLKEVKNER